MIAEFRLKESQFLAFLRRFLACNCQLSSLILVAGCLFAVIVSGVVRFGIGFQCFGRFLLRSGGFGWIF